MQKRIIVPVATLACVLAGGIIGSHLSPTKAADVMPGAIYAQLSSGMSQEPKDGKPLIVEMNSNDALAGLDHNDKANTGVITVKTPGAYFMVAAVQVGKDSGDTGDYMDVWMKQNGKDVDNSGCRQVIHDPKFTTVMVCQGVAECKAGDTFNVAISASSPGKGIGIKVIKPAGEPVIPSIIFSMYKIN
jgi:hypothetical protein